MMKLKKTLLAILFLSLPVLSGCSEQAKIARQSLADQQDLVQIQTFALDTIINLKAGGDNAEKVLQEAQKEIQRMENLFSITKEDSEISQINQNAGIAPVPISSDTLALLGTAKDINKLTNHSFDITIAPVVKAWGFTEEKQQVPAREELDSKLQLVNEDYLQVNMEDKTAFLEKTGMAIDLGGIAKGYISDSITALLKENGIQSGILSLGGNISAIGLRSNGEKWNVAVQDPLSEQNYIGTLLVSDVSVITSGGYQRYFEENGETYHHIIDPNTGYPAKSGLLSVTIVSSNGTKADGLSTALFVLGLENSIELWKNSDDFEVIFVTEDKKVLVTEGIAPDFTFKGTETGYQYQVIEKN